MNNKKRLIVGMLLATSISGFACAAEVVAEDLKAQVETNKQQIEVNKQQIEVNKNQIEVNAEKISDLKFDNKMIKQNKLGKDEFEDAMKKRSSLVDEKIEKVEGYGQEIVKNRDQIEVNKNQIETIGLAVDSRSAAVDSRFATVDSRLNNLDKKVDRQGALSAALSALKAQDYDGVHKTQILAGVGYYSGQSGVALGVSHVVNDDINLNSGIAFDNSSKVMANFGISFKVGHGSVKNVNSELTYNELKRENEEIKAKNEKMQKQIEMLMKHVGLR